MPKIRTNPKRYEELQALIDGRLGVLHMSRTELAERMGYCRQTISDRISHPEKMTIGDLEQIRRILGIPADALRAALFI